MATIDFIKPVTENTQIVVVSWVNLQNGDDGQSYPHGWYADRTVQVFGTFGAGGKLIVEGSIDGATWAQLHDAFGNNAEFTAAGVALIAEITRYVRVRVTGGDGSTNLTAMMIGRAA